MNNYTMAVHKYLFRLSKRNAGALREMHCGYNASKTEDNETEQNLG